MASGPDLVRIEKQRAKYARRRLRALKLRLPGLPSDILLRAPLRTVSCNVRRAGAGQTTLGDAGSGAPRRDENAPGNTQRGALIQMKISCTPLSKVSTVREDSESESIPTPHE